MHSYHCLLDVPQCLEGGFEMLEAPPLYPYYPCPCPCPCPCVHHAHTPCTRQVGLDHRTLSSSRRAKASATVEGMAPPHSPDGEATAAARGTQLVASFEAAQAVVAMDVARAEAQAEVEAEAVSYTHLTLPTIYSV